MRDPGEACYWYRNADGFCYLENRCWAGKPCPKTRKAADAARDALVDEKIRLRDEAVGARG